MNETRQPASEIRDGGPDFAKLPLRLLRQRGLSYAAKCLYARLTLYAGKDGLCNPSHRTLADDIGASDRHIRELLSELRGCGLLSWRRTQKANAYSLHPPEHLRAPDRNKPSGQPGGKSPVSSEEDRHSDRKETSDKKMSLNRGSSREVPSKEQSDYDCLPQNRKNRDSAADVRVLSNYPNLRNHLRKHLREADPSQPSANKLIRIIQAAEHAPEAEIVKALRNIEERGYDASHIQTYAYFETALADYFRQKQDREEAANPSGYDQWSDRNYTRLSREEFDAMTDAIEIPH
jgi:hypothetical protein